MKIIYVIGTTLKDANLLVNILVEHYGLLKNTKNYSKKNNTSTIEIPQIEIRVHSLKTIMNEDAIPFGAKPYLTPNALIQGNTFDIFNVQSKFQSLKIKGGNKE